MEYELERINSKPIKVRMRFFDGQTELLTSDDIEVNDQINPSSRVKEEYKKISVTIRAHHDLRIDNAELIIDAGDKYNLAVSHQSFRPINLKDGDEVTISWDIKMDMR